MRILPFNIYKEIYKDKATEEGYHEYKIVMSKIWALLDFCESMDKITVNKIEKSLTLKEFSKLENRGHLNAISKTLVRFSENAAYDHFYFELKEVEIVFNSNVNLHNEFKKKGGRIMLYFNEHPLHNKIPLADRNRLHNKILETYFTDDVATIEQAKQLLRFDDSVFLKIIDDAFTKRVNN